MNPPLFGWCYIGDVDETSLVVTRNKSRETANKSGNKFVFLGDVKEQSRPRCKWRSEWRQSSSPNNSSSSSNNNTDDAAAANDKSLTTTTATADFEGSLTNLDFDNNNNGEQVVPFSPIVCQSNSQSQITDHNSSLNRIGGTSPTSVAFSDADMQRIYPTGKPPLPYTRRNSILVRDRSSLRWPVVSTTTTTTNNNVVPTSTTTTNEVAVKRTPTWKPLAHHDSYLENKSWRSHKSTIADVVVHVDDDEDDDDEESESTDEESVADNDDSDDDDLHISLLETMTKEERRERAKLAWQFAHDITNQLSSSMNASMNSSMNSSMTSR